ncbi:MAG: restriction endonuclease subunit S [Candidatus Zixiibacteriota bacterium]
MSFPRYPKYKDSDVEWLGKIPQSWGISRIGYEAWVRARLGWKGLKADEYVSDGYVFLATPNIKGTEIDFENVNYIDQFRFDESPEIKLREGDVLLAKDGSTLGTVNIVRQLRRSATVNSSIAVITPGNKLDGVYLYYLFQSDFLAHTIHRIKGGMGVPHLFQEDLNKFYIPLPSASEQLAIGRFLDLETAKIDALIAEQQRLIKLLTEKRQAVISHAVTKGLNPDAPMKNSGVEWLGEVPAHWEVKRLRFVASFNPSKREQAHLSRETEISFLPMEAIGDDGSLVLEHTRLIGDVESGYTYFREGDVTIAKITPCFENGKGAVMRGLLGEIGFGTTELIVVRPHDEFVINNYLHWIFISTPFRQLGEASMYGAGGQKRVPDNFVRDFSIAIPDVAEQFDIIVFLGREVSKLNALTAEAQRGIELLRERRTALISAAVTGKIDVRGLAAPEFAATAACG